MPVTAEHELYRRLLAGHRAGPQRSLSARARPPADREREPLAATLHAALVDAYPLLAAGPSVAAALVTADGVTPVGPVEAPSSVLAGSGVHVLLWGDIAAACAAAGPAGYGQLLVRVGIAASVLAAAATKAGWRAEVITRPGGHPAEAPRTRLATVILREHGDD